MSVKVWDSALGAYRDAGLVRRYDRESGAWADCQEARAQKEGAWQRVWPERLYLYNQGDECVGVTGGWVSPPMGVGMTLLDCHQYQTGASYYRRTKEGGSLRLAQGGCYGHVSFLCKNPISVRGYRHLVYDCSFVFRDSLAVSSHMGAMLKDVQWADTRVGPYDRNIEWETQGGAEYTKGPPRYDTSRGAWVENDILKYPVDTSYKAGVYIGFWQIMYNPNAVSYGTALNECRVHRVWLER